MSISSIEKINEVVENNNFSQAPHFDQTVVEAGVGEFPATATCETNAYTNCGC